MSKFVLTNASVTIAGIDASGYTRNVQIELEAEMVDITPLGADMSKVTMDGQRTAQVTLDVMSGNSALEAQLKGAYDTGDSIDVAVRVTAIAPTFTVPCVVTAWAPWGGAVGEVAKALIGLATAGDVVISETIIEALVLDGVLMVHA